MGLFGSDDNNSGQQRANQLLDEQIRQSKDELEQKRRSIVDQRLAILKSEGVETWVPDRSSSYQESSTKPRSGGWFTGFMRDQQ